MRPASFVALDTVRGVGENCTTKLRGHIQNGVVVIDGYKTFPEGAEVLVIPCRSPAALVAKVRKPAKLPIIESD